MPPAKPFLLSVATV